MTSRDRLERLLEGDIEAHAPGYEGSLAPVVGGRIARRQAVIQRRLILGSSALLGIVLAALLGGSGLAGTASLLIELMPDPAQLTGAVRDVENLTPALPLLLAIVAVLATPFLAEGD